MFACYLVDKFLICVKSCLSYLLYDRYAFFYNLSKSKV